MSRKQLFSMRLASIGLAMLVASCGAADAFEDGLDSFDDGRGADIATTTAELTAPPIRGVRLAIILCKFLDKPIATRPPGFYQDFYTRFGTGGVADYFHDVTFGGLDLTTSQVFGWLTMNHNSAEVYGLTFPEGRNTLVQWGRDAAAANLIDLSTFDGVIVVQNWGIDHGAAGNGVVIVDGNPAFVEGTFISHEMGHLLGLGHSFGEPVICYNSAGEYCDPWDIMSAMNVYNYAGTFAGVSGSFGPGVNLFDMKRLGGLPAGGTFTIGAPDFSSAVDLGPLNQPLQPSGYIGVEILPSASVPARSDRITLEYRHRAGWDQAILADAIIVHAEKSGRSYLQPTPGGSSLLAGQRYVSAAPKVYAQVSSINASLSRAQVRVWDLPEGSLRREDSDPKVYLVENGRRRWVTSPAALFDLGKTWADVRVVPDGGTSDLPDGRPIPDGIEMWAALNSGGGMVRGTGVVATSHLGPGRYEVVFKQNVAGCGYTATIGDPANGLVFSPGLIFTAGGHTSASAVYVETKNPGGGLQDYPFHLAVACDADVPWAVVGSVGNPIRGGALVGATQLSPGRYEVEFNRNVAGCGYTATIGDTANGLVFSPGLVFTAGGHSSPFKVYVETKNPGGGLQQYPFHLAVSCGPSQPWAVVMGNGAGVRGGALVGTTRFGPGRYEIQFARNVAGCAYTATVGDPANGLVFNPGWVFTASGHLGTSGVYVETKNLGGGLQDYPFHLAVTCSSPSSYSFSASNTNSGQQNTVNQNVTINAGQSITLGTCGVAGGNFTGDTYLRLFGPALTQVAANDDACGGLGSYLTYAATATGTYQIRAGCYSSGSCSGTVAWIVQ